MGRCSHGIAARWIICLAVAAHPLQVQGRDQADVAANATNLEANPKVVFSLTTVRRRLRHLRPVLEAIVQEQSRVPDAVFLALPPDIDDLPAWLLRFTEQNRVLQLLRMAVDYGPASKLLAALAEGAERGSSTVIIYGDDDVLYSPKVVEMHLRAHQAAKAAAAFGTRRISIGEGSKEEILLEGVGTVSVVASSVPEAVFQVTSVPPVCRLSDDYWISRHLMKAGVELRLLPDCVYDFHAGRWPRSCGHPFEPMEEIRHIDALSETLIASDGSVARRSGGDWRAQLRRYSDCQRFLNEQLRDEL